MTTSSAKYRICHIKNKLNLHFFAKIFQNFSFILSRIRSRSRLRATLLDIKVYFSWHLESLLWQRSGCAATTAILGFDDVVVVVDVLQVNRSQQLAARGISFSFQLQKCELLAKQGCWSRSRPEPGFLNGAGAVFFVRLLLLLNCTTC